MVSVSLAFLLPFLVSLCMLTIRLPSCVRIFRSVLSFRFSRVMDVVRGPSLIILNVRVYRWVLGLAAPTRRWTLNGLQRW